MFKTLSRNPLVLPVYAPTLLLAFGGGMLTPVWPLYAASFGASYAWIGIVLAARGLGTILGDLPAGILVSKLGQKRLMLAGLAIIALCGLATSQAHSVWELLIFGTLEGVGAAFWNISRHAYLTHAAPSGQRGRAIATFGGIFRTGSRRFVGRLAGIARSFYGLRSGRAAHDDLSRHLWQGQHAQPRQPRQPPHEHLAGDARKLSGVDVG